MIRKLLALSVFAGALFAQRSVPPGTMYHHVWAVVPFVGAGTSDDPKRPMLTPSPSDRTALPAGARPDLISYSVQLSDNGQFALVDFVFADPIAYHNVLRRAASVVPGVSSTAQALPAISPDGSNVGALSSNIATLKAAYETAVPGVHLMERGKVTEAQILTTFQQYKASFSFTSSTAVAQ